MDGRQVLLLIEEVERRAFAADVVAQRRREALAELVEFGRGVEDFCRSVEEVRKC